MAKFSKYLTKDYIILGVMLLTNIAVSFLSVVINHYKHNLGIAWFLLILVYIFYIRVKNDAKNKPKHLEAKSIALGLVLLSVWGTMLTEPTSEVYLGSESIIINNKRDVKQITLSNRINYRENKIVLFFNPNDKISVSVIPDILKPVNPTDLKQIAFVDITNEFGIELADEYAIKKAPTYLILEYREDFLLAYNTKGRAKVFQDNVDYFHYWLENY